ncbi:hypothetical protein ACNIRM_25155, partial [Escherichia coli]
TPRGGWQHKKRPTPQQCNKNFYADTGRKKIIAPPNPHQKNPPPQNKKTTGKKGNAYTRNRTNE